MSRRVTVSPREPLTSEHARALTDEVKRDAAALWAKLLELYEGGAHVALGYSAWAGYCEAEFGMGKSRAYQVLDAARVVEALPESTMVERPSSERVARELVPALREDPELVSEAWAETVERHGPGATAAQTGEVVRGATAPAPCAPLPTDRCVVPDALQAALRHEFRFTGKAELEGGEVRVGSQFEAGVQWVNPPASTAARWVRAARDFASVPGCVAVCVVPVDTAASWWWTCCRHGEVRFLREPLVWIQAGEERALAAAIIVFGRRPCVRWWDVASSASAAPAAAGTERTDRARTDDASQAKAEPAETQHTLDAELARVTAKFPELGS